jgi:Cof subfamily protein (haloacid dehalogenase superfamily)
VTRLPRLIATDIDGTLAHPDGTVSARSAKALAAVCAAGSVVVLVTGRPIRWLPRVYAVLAAPYIAVCANGAAVYDPVDDSVLSAEIIDGDVLVEATGRIRAALPQATFAVETGRRLLHESAYPVRPAEDDPDTRVADLAEMCTVAAVKLLVRAPNWEPDAFTARVADAVGDAMEATHSSHSGLVELSAPGVTKGAGLAAYASSHGFGPADALVFGDMPNDLSMFAWAGAGVAVANAHPSVRAAATAITASNAEDGVAMYLEALL